MRRRLAPTLLLALAAFAAPSGAASAAPAPIVAVSVATKDGTLIGPVAVRAKATRVKVGGKRCAVSAGTPLAALVALQAKARRAPKVGTIRLRDYASCGSRPSSSSRLYLTGIGADRASGPDGWIYEVNGKGGSTSAADPSGPFGRGRIKAGSTVNWRWCRISEDPEGDCGDTLEIGKVGKGWVDAGAPGVRYTIPVLLRTGADGDSNGRAAPAPAGTSVELIAPTGEVIVAGAVGTDGTAILETRNVPPRDARIVARGAAGVAPAGQLMALPTS